MLPLCVFIIHDRLSGIQSTAPHSPTFIHNVIRCSYILPHCALVSLTVPAANSPAKAFSCLYSGINFQKAVLKAICICMHMCHNVVCKSTSIYVNMWPPDAYRMHSNRCLSNTLERQLATYANTISCSLSLSPTLHLYPCEQPVLHPSPSKIFGIF